VITLQIADSSFRQGGHPTETRPQIPDSNITVSRKETSNTELESVKEIFQHTETEFPFNKPSNRNVQERL
jgi:hypothetical protein